MATNNMLSINVSVHTRSLRAISGVPPHGVLLDAMHEYIESLMQQQAYLYRG